MRSRRLIVHLVAVAVGAVVGFALWRWAAGRQYESFWWFLLAMSPTLLATLLADAANDALDRRHPPVAPVDRAPITYVPPDFDS